MWPPPKSLRKTSGRPELSVRTARPHSDGLRPAGADMAGCATDLPIARTPKFVADADAPVAVTVDRAQLIIIMLVRMFVSDVRLARDRARDRSPERRNRSRA